MRQRQANRAGTTLADERVAHVHQRLGHAVSLEDHVAEHARRSPRAPAPAGAPSRRRTVACARRSRGRRSRRSRAAARTSSARRRTAWAGSPRTSRSAFSCSKRSTRRMWQPLASQHWTPLPRPWTWNSGSAARYRSALVMPQRGHQRERVGREVAVREDRALGDACGARRVDQRDWRSRHRRACRRPGRAMRVRRRRRVRRRPAGARRAEVGRAIARS